MKAINRKILEQVISASAEPLLIVRIDHPDWPVALSNDAFAAIGGKDIQNKPFADVVEQLVGRDLALEISEAIRSHDETSLPIELSGREYLLALRPLTLPGESRPKFYAAFWRTGIGAVAGTEIHHELLKAKRRIRDLSRDDPVTGLLNKRAFYDVLEHDWVVASREKRPLSIVLFTLDDFAAYTDVFGQHAADSCMRRVGQTIRRCLRRASDVIGRIEGSQLAVLSHASDEGGVREFGGRISAAVRELGLHHPRSSVAKFVTVSFEIGVSTKVKEDSTARELLEDLLSRSAK